MTTETVNHDEAYQYACLEREHSNLARCYIDLRATHELQAPSTKETSNPLVVELKSVSDRPDFAQIYLRHLCQRAAAAIEHLENVTTLREQIDSLMAEVSRLSAENASFRSASKPSAIRWTDEQDQRCSYTHLIGHTPFGRILITWKGWKKSHDMTLDESPWGATGYVGSTVEQAKENVEAEFGRRLAMCRPTPPSDSPFGYIIACKADGRWCDVVKPDEQHELLQGYESIPIYSAAQSPESTPTRVELLRFVDSVACYSRYTHDGVDEKEILSNIEHEAQKLCRVDSEEPKQ